MTAYKLEKIKAGFAVNHDGMTVTAESPIRDRGVNRCTLSVSKNNRLVYRDNVNLTGERARARFLRRLAEKSLKVPESLLLALDEAFRAPPPPKRDSTQKTPYDGSSDESGTPISIAEMTRIVDRWLAMRDRQALTIMVGAVAAHRLGGESPWLLLVAPPSGSKTELLRMLWTLPDVFPLSELTSKTFASGLDTKGEGDPSLLARLNQEILVLKDLTTVLEMNREERQAILAQMREIYDGRFDKAWGTGKEIHWEGRLGFLAGVTPVIDRHTAVMGLLGPRFLILRVEQPDRNDMAIRAMKNAQQEKQMRDELGAAMRCLFAGIGREAPAVSDEIRVLLAKIADLLTRARSPVERDGYKREFDYAPEPEAPGRAARQLCALLRGITLTHGRDDATLADLELVARVARDSIPAVRWMALGALAEAEGARKTTTEVARSVQYASSTVRRALEDLQALGLVDCNKGGSGHPDSWTLKEVHIAAIRLLTRALTDFEEGFPDLSVGASDTNLELVGMGGVL